MGVLAITLGQYLQPENFEAFSQVAQEYEIFQMLDGSGEIRIQWVDPLHALVRSSDRYDVIVSGKPFPDGYDRISFGRQSQEPLLVRVGDEDRKVNDKYGNVLILQSCLHLTENGRGIFIVSNDFFSAASRKGMARRILEELGFRITVAIELPAGTFRPFTSLTAHLVVLQRSSTANLFTAKYAPDSKYQQQLLRNLIGRSRGRSSALGQLVPADIFRGFSAIELAERVKEQSQRMGLAPYPFAEVVVELNPPSSSKNFERFPEKPNAVYLPLMASTDATTSQESLPERLKSYYQLVLNPEIADAEFVARLLNTHFGQLWRDSLRTGETIPRIGKKTLEEAIFYLPPVRARDIQQRVVECHRTISALKNELHEVEATLWNRPTNIDQAQTALRMVNRENRFEDWIDRLPFPLASILWMCHTQAGSHRDQYERKIHFFEALSEFLAVLHLSAFTNNPTLWPPLKDRLNKVLAKQSLSLARATFGTWKVVVEILTAEARRLLSSETEMCFDLFKTRNRELIGAIASKLLVSVIQDANAIRNNWIGHTGAVSEADAKRVNEVLNRHIETVREAFGLCWENYELLLPAECRIKAGVYSYKSRKVMGSRTPFPYETVELIEAMEDGCLYLKSPDEPRALRLLPFVKVMPSPKTEENACYFYNRLETDGIRFLSYHFEADSEVVQDFTDTAEALRKLSES